MVLPRITPAASRLYSYIKSASGRGLSASAALADLRAMGRGVRRTDFLRLYAESKGSYQAGQHIRNIRKDYLPDPSRIPTAITNIRRNYSFVTRLDIDKYDPATKQFTRVNRYITVTTDRLMTAGEMESTALDVYNSKTYAPDDRVEQVTVVSALGR